MSEQDPSPSIIWGMSKSELTTHASELRRRFQPIAVYGMDKPPGSRRLLLTVLDEFEAAAKAGDRAKMVNIVSQYEKDAEALEAAQILQDLSRAYGSSETPTSMASGSPQDTC